MGLWKYDKYLCKKYSCEKNYIKHYFLANDILQKVIMFDPKYTVNGYSKTSDEKIVKRKKTIKQLCFAPPISTSNKMQRFTI